MSATMAGVGPSEIPDRVVDDDTTMQTIVDWHAEDRPDCDGGSFIMGKPGFACPRCAWWAGVD